MTLSNFIYHLISLVGITLLTLNDPNGECPLVDCEALNRKAQEIAQNITETTNDVINDIGNWFSGLFCTTQKNGVILEAKGASGTEPDSRAESEDEGLQRIDVSE